MKRLLRPALGLAAGLVITACAGLALRPGPAPDEGPPDETAAPPPEEPVLTVDETYTAISLSVRAGRPEEALAAYREAQLQDPGNPQTLLLLANLYLIAGSPGDAEGLVADVLADVLSDVLADEQDRIDALYMSSLVAAATGDREGQRATLRRVLAIDAQEPRALASLGELYLEDGDLEAAGRAFASAVEREPTDVVARMGLGNVYLRQEQYAAAQQEFTRVIADDSGYAYAYADRARARALQRDLRGADEDLTLAIELDPGFPWHYVDRGRVRMEQRRFAEAASDFGAAIDLDPERFLPYVLRARAYDALDRYEPARADYLRALELRPDYHPAYAPFATLCYLDNRPGDAARYYRKAYETDRRRLDFVLLAALSLKADGRPAEATDLINRELSRFPRESLYYQVARYYLLPTNEGYLLAEIQREQDDTVKGQAYFYLGAQLELLGRTQTARASLLEAEDTLPAGFPERRLASRLLERYRDADEEGR